MYYTIIYSLSLSPADGTADSDWSSTGCGPCETDDGNCITCEGDSCNSVIYGTPHSCFNYEWDQEASGGGKFEVQEEKTDCRRVAGDEVNCNRSACVKTVIIEKIICVYYIFELRN